MQPNPVGFVIIFTPPFCEAIGLNVSYHLSSGQNPPQCRWEECKVGLTMNKVWGQGLCLGTVLHDKTPLYAQTISNLCLHGKNWIVPEVGGWWICSHTGLTPCLNVKVFNQSQEFRVLVAVMPKILYHSEEVMYSHWDREMLRQKRANQCDHHGSLVQSWAGKSRGRNSFTVSARPGVFLPTSCYR